MNRVMLIAVMSVVALASAGCTITTRSNNYACTDGEDCEALGRECVNGWCVERPCPDECDSCDQDNTVCIIECEEVGECLASVVCPSGMPCIVECGDGNCTGGVDCRNASECEITCSGTGSCTGQIVCGAGPCDVDCDGFGSCSGGVNCSASCACVTSCSDDACTAAHSCPGNANCTDGTICKADTGNCNQC